MGELERQVERARKAQEGAARTGLSAVDTTMGALKSTTAQVGQDARQMTGETWDRQSAATETIVQAAAKATDVVTSMIPQGSAQVSRAMAAVSGTNGAADPSADVGYGRDSRSSAARTPDDYSVAAKDPVDTLQALLQSSLALGRGIQQMQYRWLQTLQRVAEPAVQASNNMLPFGSVIALAEAQQALYFRAIDHAFETTGQFLGLAGRVAQNTVGARQSPHS